MANYTELKGLIPYTKKSTVYVLTIPASNVYGTVDLVNFPLFIDLSVMPNQFFDDARYDGGNIRVYDKDNNQLPVDIQDFRKFSKGGKIWVKVSKLHTNYATELTIKLLDKNSVAEPHYSNLGGSEVWKEYLSVFLGGYNTYSNTNNKRGQWYSNSHTRSLKLEGQVGPRFDDDFHQGMAWDAETGNTILIDNNLIVLYDADWNEIARNSDPSGDAETATGLTLGHTCDGTVVDDWFIMPINNYPASNQITMSVFDKRTLAHIKSTIIEDANISGVCWNDDIKNLVTCSWGAQSTDWTSMYKFNLNMNTGDVTANGAIILKPSGELINSAQGIEYHMGRYWVSDDYRTNIVPVESDGSYDRNGGVARANYDNTGISSNFEGITVYRDGLAVLIDPFDGINSGTGLPYHDDNRAYILYWTAEDGYRTDVAGEHWETDTELDDNGVFTVGITASPSIVQQMALVSFHESGTANVRATLTARTSAGGFKLGLWDSSNSWLMEDTPVDIVAGETHRINGVWGSTSRTLYVDGAAKTAAGTYTTKLTTLNKVFVGTSDDDGGESAVATLGFAYVYPGALTAGWIATENAMLDTSTFLVVAAKKSKEDITHLDVDMDASNISAKSVFASELEVSDSIELGGHQIKASKDGIVFTEGSKIKVNSTFDFDTRISNIGTQNEVKSVYHQADTGPWTQSFYTEGEMGENKHLNTEFKLGVVPFGGIGEPMIALFYRDDGDDRDGMLARGEITQAQYDAKPGNTFNPENRFGNEDKILWITEPGGTFAVVRDRAGSCYEAFTWDDHTTGASGGPSLRIGSSSGGGHRGAYIEFGRGKSADADFRMARGRSDLIDFRVNNNNGKLSIHNSMTWRRGITLNDGMALYFVNDGEEVIESFTAAADFEQSYTVVQTLGAGYEVKDVMVNGEGVYSAAVAVDGQVVTITSHEYNDTESGLEGSNVGRTVRAGDTIHIRMTYPRGNTLRLKADYDAANSRSILNLGGVLKVTDLVNGAGDSAFGGSGTFADAGNVGSLDGVLDAAVFRASGATDLPPGGGNYGAGLSVKSDGGNAGFQLYSDYGDGDLFWRTGLPGSTGWNATWYKAASTAYVDTAIAGVSGFSGDYNDLTNLPTLFSGDYNDLTNKAWDQIEIADADLATTNSMYRITGTTNFPANVGNYGAGWTIKPSTGNSGVQFASNYGNGTLVWRTGLPTSTGWNPDWYTVASTEYVDTKIGDVLNLPILTAEPASPTDGMVAIADGTSWNPTGTGTQTMVVRLAGAWRQLAAA